jgi:hypothetical protein
MRKVAILVSATLGLSACGSPEKATAAGERFAVFRDHALTMTSLEKEYAPPLTVGSTGCPETIISDSPDVVSVTSSGGLVAHRQGRANVTGIGSPFPLSVDVRIPGALVIAPRVVVLTLRGRAGIALADGEGSSLDPRDAVWTSSDPTIAVVIDGVVEARGKTGTAAVSAKFGGATAEARVEVRALRR